MQKITKILFAWCLQVNSTQLTIFSWNFVPFSCADIVFIVFMTLGFYWSKKRATHILSQRWTWADPNTRGESVLPNWGHETSGWRAYWVFPPCLQCLKSDENVLTWCRSFLPIGIIFNGFLSIWPNPSWSFSGIELLRSNDKLELILNSSSNIEFWKGYLLFIRKCVTLIICAPISAALHLAPCWLYLYFSTKLNKIKC